MHAWTKIDEMSLEVWFRVTVFGCKNILGSVFIRRGDVNMPFKEDICEDMLHHIIKSRRTIPVFQTPH